MMAPLLSPSFGRFTLRGLYSTSSRITHATQAWARLAPNRGWGRLACSAPLEQLRSLTPCVLRWCPLLGAMQCSQQAGPGACDQPGRRAPPPSSACAFRTVKWPQHCRRQLWTIIVTVAVAPNLGTAWARSSDHRQQCVFGYAGHNAAPQRPAHTAPAPAPAPAPTPTRCAVCGVRRRQDARGYGRGLLRVAPPPWAGGRGAAAHDAGGGCGVRAHASCCTRTRTHRAQQDF